MWWWIFWTLIWSQPRNIQRREWGSWRSVWISWQDDLEIELLSLVEISTWETRKSPKLEDCHLELRMSGKTSGEGRRWDILGTCKETRTLSGLANGNPNVDLTGFTSEPVRPATWLPTSLVWWDYRKWRELRHFPRTTGASGCSWSCPINNNSDNTTASLSPGGVTLLLSVRQNFFFGLCMWNMLHYTYNHIHETFLIKIKINFKKCELLS